jgi:hydrophobe/amphiphile efflux-1 (HAE1) family protein
MALVIAIGLVVDDAIVMLENIYRRVEGGESPLIASYKGASQVSFAIIATTVVLIAVFVPLVFVKGIVGKLFTELALTLSFSIVISAFVALTLSPMLASKYLKVSHSKPNFLKKFDSYLDKFSNFYFETLLLLLYKKKEIIIFLVGVLISVIILFKITPKELIPPEDRGVFYVVIQAPDGSGFEYTKEKVENIEKIFLADLGKGLYREILVRVPGFQSGIDQVNTGFLIVLLEDWGKRKKFSNENLGGIFQQLNSFPGVKAFPIMPQGLRGGAGEKPVQFVLKGNTYEELIKWKEILKTEIVKNKNLVNVDDDLDLTKPQLKIKINADKAADLGVSVDSIAKTIETMFGSKEVTKYTKDGREYSVMLQADVKNRREPSNLNKVVVRSSSGKLVPLTSVATFYEESTYTSLNRYNRQRAVTISARLVGGYTISEALNYLEGITKEKLPANARVDYKGESLEFKNTSSDIYFIFILALFTAYLSLAAQFESWRHPLTIMLTVPLAILGGIIGLWVIGSSLNIYSQIALIVLIGLAAKNGILIVEFANQLRTQGLQLKEAIIESCRVRLRPILMTSVATIIGVVPLIIATGPGAASRATVGIVIFMGMLFATLFTLYVIPVMYLIIGKNTGRMDAVEIELEKQLKEASSK